MSDGPIQILLVDDNLEYAALIKEVLKDYPAFQFNHAANLASAFEMLAKGSYQLVLLDLNLPDSRGLDTFDRVREEVVKTPIIILTGLDDEALALVAVGKGAQDYVVKGLVDPPWIVRMMRYAIERRKAEESSYRTQHQDISEAKRAVEQLQQKNLELALSERSLLQALEELRTSNQRLKEAQMQLIQSGKMESVGLLAAGVAHEVKNPLAIIQLGVEYLERKIPPADFHLKRTYEDIQEAVKRADLIVRGLVDFAASRELNLKAMNLNDVVEAAFHLIKHEVVKTHVVVRKNLPLDLPACLLDRHCAEQVFVNIFLNAIHAMPRGGDLVVTTRKAEGGGGSGGVEAVIEDQGTGIEKEHLEKIFDPFFTTKSPGKGTGLGLTVAQRIVELHGGTIHVQNRSEGGVRVTLKFKSAKTTSV